MGSRYCFLFERLNQLTEFLEIWYERYAIGNQFKSYYSVPYNQQ
jgi:hypothetical protein